jgi:hypothetical protein
MSDRLAPPPTPALHPLPPPVHLASSWKHAYQLQPTPSRLLRKGESVICASLRGAGSKTCNTPPPLLLVPKLVIIGRHAQIQRGSIEAPTHSTVMPPEAREARVCPGPLETRRVAENAAEARARLCRCWHNELFTRRPDAKTAVQGGVTGRRRRSVTCYVCWAASVLITGRRQCLLVPTHTCNMRSARACTCTYIGTSACSPANTVVHLRVRRTRRTQSPQLIRWLLCALAADGALLHFLRAVRARPGASTAAPFIAVEFSALDRQRCSDALVACAQTRPVIRKEPTLPGWRRGVGATRQSTLNLERLPRSTRAASTRHRTAATHQQGKLHKWPNRFVQAMHSSGVPGASCSSPSM